MNASIAETRLLAGILGRRHTMTVGLPLLILLDEEAIEAIVAHEVAHASLMHTTGTVNLVEFNNVFDALFAYADPDETVMGRLAHFALAGLWRYLNAELQRRSRQCEIEADAMAAEWTSPGAAARALALVSANVGLVSAEVYQRYEAEMLGAISIPKSPIMRIREGRDKLMCSPAMHDHAMEAFQTEDDPDSSHPGLRERLRKLGLSALPELSCGPSAAASMLAAGELERVLSELDRDWAKLADAKLEGHTLVHY
jgi:Zn-dependent protease with chaperone function